MRSRRTSGSMSARERREMEQIYAEYWRRLKNGITERVLYGVALSLHDTCGFGAKRIDRVLRGLVEIINGYSEDTYGSDGDGLAETADNIEAMNDKMRAECEARGLHLQME